MYKAILVNLKIKELYVKNIVKFKFISFFFMYLCTHLEFYLKKNHSHELEARLVLHMVLSMLTRGSHCLVLTNHLLKAGEKQSQHITIELVLVYL